MIRVLLADDEELVRSGLRLILEAAEDIRVVAEARDGAEAVRAVELHRPDVVLMDIRMPGTDGIAATRQITGTEGAPGVVVLTTFDADEYVYGALRAGAVGFLLKDTPPRDLANAVRTVAEGNAMLSPILIRRLITDFAAGEHPRQTEARRRLGVLTDREVDVLRLVGTGRSNAEIAGLLYMSEATVKAHVSRLLAKLDLTNRVNAAILAHDAGLLDADR